MTPTAKSLARAIQKETHPESKVELMFEAALKVVSDSESKREDVIVVLNAVMVAIKSFFIVTARPPGDPEKGLKKMADLGIKFAAKEITKQTISYFAELYISNPLPEWYLAEVQRAGAKKKPTRKRISPSKAEATEQSSKHRASPEKTQKVPRRGR